MTNSTAAILKIISKNYNIPYDDLVSLVNAKTKKKTATKNNTSSKTYEYISLDQNNFMYDDETNALYTYDESDPQDTMTMYGYLIPETLEVIQTLSL